jgi:hypothetical protein
MKQFMCPALLAAMATSVPRQRQPKTKPARNSDVRQKSQTDADSRASMEPPSDFVRSPAEPLTQRN